MSKACDGSPHNRLLILFSPQKIHTLKTLYLKNGINPSVLISPVSDGQRHHSTCGHISREPFNRVVSEELHIWVQLMAKSPLRIKMLWMEVLVC